MKTPDETNVSQEKVNEMLELNKVSGEYFEKYPTEPQLPDGWNKVKAERDTNTNFKGVVYKNQNDEYAAVFLGTDVKNPKDWQANAEMLNGNPNKQCEKAVEFYKKNIEAENIPPEKVTVVGNSEGGREVVEVLSKTSAENGVTFNGFTKVKKEDYPPENFEKLINFRTKDDIVSKCGTTIGTDYIVPVKEDINLKPVYKAIQSHRIDNIDKINDENAIPAKDYEAITGERFKNKYGEGTLKSYEIGEIPSELYPIVDPDVNEKLEKGEVENAILNETKPQPSSISDNSSIYDFDIDKFKKEQQEKFDNMTSDIMRNIYTENPTTPTYPEPPQETPSPQPDFTPPEKEKKQEEQELPKQTKSNRNHDNDNIKKVYVWVSENGACEKCQELDGACFSSKEDIPGLPHPNCKCHVEEYQVQEKEKEDDDDDNDDDNNDDENEDTNEQPLPTFNKNFGSKPFSFLEKLFPAFSVLTNPSTTFLPEDKEMERMFGKNTFIEEIPHGGVYDKEVFIPETRYDKGIFKSSFYLPEYDDKGITFFNRKELPKESKTKVFGLPIIKKMM